MGKDLFSGKILKIEGLQSRKGKNADPKSGI